MMMAELKNRIVMAGLAMVLMTPAFAFSSEQWAVEAPGCTLAGTLLLPENGNSTDKAGETVPAVLIIAGSGPTDRNGNSILMQGRNNSLKMLAEGLAEDGIASLRYDKRGVGESRVDGLKEEETIFEHFITDAEMWISKLKSDKRIGPIIVIGHSEGSLIGMIAAQGRGVSAFISIGGQGRPIDQVVEDQLLGQPEFVRKGSDRILEKLRQGKLVDDVPDFLAPLYRKSVQPYLISMMQYDPAAELQRLKIPVLLVQGGRDLQVGMKDFELLSRAKPDARTAVYPTMNHVLKMVTEDQQDNLQAYTDPEYPLPEELVEDIVNFIYNIGGTR
jgi:pimeloyl-ACP methyl ester carboxylesterase